MFCLSEAALLDSIRGCAASRLLVKATGAWPSWCLLLRFSALLPGFLHQGRARWLKPPSKPRSCGEHRPGHRQGKLTALGAGVLCAIDHLGWWRGHSPAPAPAAPLLQTLQPCSWVDIPPPALRLACPAAPNAGGLCDGDVKGSSASLCVLEHCAIPCHSSPLGQGSSCPHMRCGRAWVPRGAGAHSTQICRCLGCACNTSLLREVVWLLDANPPLLCAKTQNILIHVSLSCFFSFPC